jgi:8-amino-7-oxononanoate synthase/acyl carrier protein
MATDSKRREELPSAFTEAVLEQVHLAMPEGLECELTLDTALDDLGVDSITMMSLLNRLEETFGVRFTEDAFYDLETCRDVVEYIETSVSQAGGKGPAARSATPVQRERSADKELSSEPCDVREWPECVAFEQRLTSMTEAGFENPFYRVKHGVNKALATIDGCEAVSYTSFDYLGLAGDPRVVEAAKAAIDQYGTSASASRLVGGNHAIVQQLDEELAQFLGTEAALALPSGFGTNESLLGHLFGEDDLIVHDELAHASIVQGAVLSRAQRRPFPHNDFEFLDRLLRDVRDKYRRVVVAIEGVYSMDGDYPDLPRFIKVKNRRRALLYVDEAHSIGVMGAAGRGICEHYQIDPCDGDLWMGTLSKALGSGGGYVAGREILIQYLKYTLPATVFATGLSPANAAAALAALHILREEPGRVTQLRDRSRLFLDLAEDHGLDTGNSEDTPVIPVIIGNSARCIQLSAMLLRRGIDVQPILYPAVPEKASRLRFFLTADHTEEQIRHTVPVVAECIAAAE